MTYETRKIGSQWQVVWMGRDVFGTYGSEEQASLICRALNENAAN